MKSKAIEVLGELPVFSILEKDELEVIAQRTKEMSFKKDEVIFREGDASGILFVVTSGAIQISTSVLEDLEKPLVVLREGAVFGEVSLIDRNPREVKATAIEDTVALGLDAGDFDRILKDQPLLGAKILKVIAQTVVHRVRLTTDQYRRNVQWGLSVSGALKLNWHRLITDEVILRLELLDGSAQEGTLLKVEESRAGYELFMQTAQRQVFIFPYHAVKSISFQRLDVMAAKAE